MRNWNNVFLGLISLLFSEPGGVSLKLESIPRLFRKRRYQTFSNIKTSGTKIEITRKRRKLKLPRVVKTSLSGMNWKLSNYWSWKLQLYWENRRNTENYNLNGHFRRCVVDGESGKDSRIGELSSLLCQNLGVGEISELVQRAVLPFSLFPSLLSSLFLLLSFLSFLTASVKIFELRIREERRIREYEFIKKTRLKKGSRELYL